MPEGFAKKGLWCAPTVYATDDELRYVAVCACADFMNETPTDNLANARLIASAPELLEALMAIAGDGVQRVSDDLLIKARAAIAKAEGQS